MAHEHLSLKANLDGYSSWSQKPAGAQDPIDTLSGDFDSCPSATETSTNTAKVWGFFLLAFFFF